MRLIVTRPQPDGARSAAALRSRGHQVMLVPLLRIEPDPDAVLGSAPWSAVLITSANAARAAAAHRRHAELVGLPLFAVGRRSAAAARAAGFADVVSADGDAGDLATLVAARVPPGRDTLPLLYLAGEERAADLAAALAAHDLAVHTVVIYRAVAESVLPPDARAALAAADVDGVLHYSRRSAETFVSAAINSGIDVKSLAMKHYSISSAAAEPLRQAGIATIAVAAHPHEAALFALIDGAG
jgi:uroporphyrinogen-III synthase